MRPKWVRRCDGIVLVVWALFSMAFANAVTAPHVGWSDDANRAKIDNAPIGPPEEPKAVQKPDESAKQLDDLRGQAQALINAHASAHKRLIAESADREYQLVVQVELLSKEVQRLTELTKPQAAKP